MLWLRYWSARAAVVIGPEDDKDRKMKMAVNSRSRGGLRKCIEDHGAEHFGKKGGSRSVLRRTLAISSEVIITIAV